MRYRGIRHAGAGFSDLVTAAPGAAPFAGRNENLACRLAAGCVRTRFGAKIGHAFVTPASSTAVHATHTFICTAKNLSRNPARISGAAWPAAPVWAAAYPFPCVNRALFRTDSLSHQAELRLPAGRRQERISRINCCVRTNVSRCRTYECTFSQIKSLVFASRLLQEFHYEFMRCFAASGDLVHECIRE